MTSPVSVILPTVTWAPACGEVADQLGPRDELLIVHDNDTDSITEYREQLPERARLISAGEPAGCSGKANAIATGMEAAAYDRIVWTDDDFPHPPDWLDELRADYERQGPTSEVPNYVGRDPLAVLFEPLYAMNATLGIYTGDLPWGGAVIFDRSDIDERAFLADLRRTISDDGLLLEYIDATTVKRTRRVAIGGSPAETIENQVRFAQIVRRHQPGDMANQAFVGGLAFVAGLLFPVFTIALLTLLIGGVYAWFGVRRPTFLLVYPAVMLAMPLIPYAVARRSFVWGGRRYRWHSEFDVTVVD